MASRVIASACARVRLYQYRRIAIYYESSNYICSRHPRTSLQPMDGERAHCTCLDEFDWRANRQNTKEYELHFAIDWNYFLLLLYFIIDTRATTRHLHDSDCNIMATHCVRSAIAYRLFVVIAIRDQRMKASYLGTWHFLFDGNHRRSSQSRKYSTDINS